MSTASSRYHPLDDQLALFRPFRDTGIRMAARAALSLL